MSKKVSIFLFVVPLLISACASETPTPGRQTLPEERTVLANIETTEETDLGPLPEPAWDKEEYILKEIANLNEPTVAITRIGEDDIWIAERQGTVKLLKRSLIKYRTAKRVADGAGQRVRVTETEYFQLVDQPVLDISNKILVGTEGGLLGLAFSSNGNFLYVSYTDIDGNSIIAEYEMAGERARPSSERILLKVEQPQSNHNGGQIQIGPDGFLYIGLGDGGGSGDPEQNSQNTQTLLGSILRIDPEEKGDDSYSIPVGNPFKGKADKGLPEIWLWGVRNPWRFSFDNDTKDMWIGDVGQNTEEEITFLERGTNFAGRGANLGWNQMEGFSSFEDGKEPNNHTNPLYSYQTTPDSCSVVGGYVYRGELIAHRINGLVDKPLEGIYVFADYCNPGIRAIQRLDDGRTIVEKLKLDIDPENVISFGEINQEIFVLEQGGRISRIQLPDTTREIQLVSPGSVFPESALNEDSRILPGEQLDEDTTTTTKN